MRFLFGGHFAAPFVRCPVVVRFGVRTHAQRRLLDGQRPQHAQQVGRALDAAHAPIGSKALQAGLHAGYHVRVQHVAQVGRAQQLAQQRGVERQQRRALLGVRQVARVEVLAHVPEQKRRRERRRHRRLRLHQAHRSRLHLLHQLVQRPHVVHVLQALARRFHQDGELALAPGSLQQLAGLEALLPQRGALARRDGRHQQGARGAFAEPRREQRRGAHAIAHDAVELVGVEREQLDAGKAGLGHGDAQDDAVVGRHGLRIVAVDRHDAVGHRHRPGLVHAAAVRRMQQHAPVALLVLAAFHHERLVVGDDARRRALRADQLDEVALRIVVEAIRGQALAHRTGHAEAPLLRLRIVAFDARGHRAQERAAHAPRLGGPPHAFAMPERQTGRAPGRGLHDHAVARDLADTPRAGAQRDDVAYSRLVHHLFVQLAHAPPALRAVAFRQHHREHPAVGDGARRHDGLALRAGTRQQPPALAIPHDARRELGQIGRRVAAGQHAQHRIEGPSRKLGIRGRAPHGVEPVVRRQLVHGHRRNRLLGQHVQRVLHERRLLDATLVHAFGRHGRVDDLGAGAREDGPRRAAAHLVVRAPDALQGAGHRRRGRHLQHEIDGSHVDAQFQRRGGHHARQLARFQLALHLQALLLRHRSVVRLRDDGRRARGHVRRRAQIRADGRRRGVRIDAARDAHALRVQVVQARRQLLAQPARVHEHDGGAVRQHLVEDGGFDVGPDGRRAETAVGTRRARRERGLRHGGAQGAVGLPRFLRRRAARPSPALSRAAPRQVASPERRHGGHVAHGHAHAHVHVGPPLGGDDAHGMGPAQEARDLVARTHGGRQPDALRRLVQQVVEALEAQSQVRAALASRQRVHFVDDDGFHGAQRLARLRREHEVQRLGRGDEDVGRVALQATALIGRGVARAHARAHFGHRAACGRHARRDAGERRLQVALHVRPERLQRRDVQHAHALAGTLLLRQIRRRRLLAHKLVDGEQERRERLARAGGCDDQRVLAALDNVPGTLLQRRGLGKGIEEPAAHLVGESRQGMRGGLACFVHGVRRLLLKSGAPMVAHERPPVLRNGRLIPARSHDGPKLCASRCG